MVGSLPKAHQVEHLLDTCPAIVGLRAAKTQRQLHVLRRRQDRDEPERLEDVGHGLASETDVTGLVQGSDLLAVDDDASGRRAVEPADDVEERRLAGPGAAGQGQELAWADTQVDAPQRVEHARAAREIPGHAVGLDQPRAARPRAAAWSAIGASLGSAWRLGFPVRRRVVPVVGRSSVDSRARGRAPVARQGRAVGPDLDVVGLEAQRDPATQAERIDVGSRQLQPAGLIEDGELLGRAAARRPASLPAAARRSPCQTASPEWTVSVLVRPSRMATCAGHGRSPGGRG